MSWKLRGASPEDAVDGGSLTPDYGSNRHYFTIKLHHSGRFLSSASSVLEYVDGKTNFIDYCTSDEISKIELASMLAAVGVEGTYNLYYSCTGVDECEFLEPILTDKDSLTLGMYSDGFCRCVGVFVDHELWPIKDISYPTVDENLGYYGDKDDLKFPAEVERDGGCSKPGEGNARGGKDGEGCSKDWEGIDSIIDLESGDESDGVVSVGDDSDHSDYLGESDVQYDIDNRDFVDYVDHDEEWGGLGDPNDSKTDVPDMPERDEFEAMHGPKHRDDSRPVDLELGMCFTDAEDFRRAIRLHAINLGRDLHFPINNKFKVQAKCKNERCDWLVYASRVKGDDTFRIKTIHDKHRCPRLNKVVHANSNFLAEKYSRKLRSDPRWPVESMLEMLKDENKLSFSKWQIYRCKSKVARVGAGIVQDQYKLLWSYGEEIMKSNPGSTVRVKCKDIGGGQVVFKRFYVCWDALKRGLLDGCRRVICFDGCHLKTSQGGVLLSAVGIDANNGIYPFAYAIVGKEKRSSWVWFIDLVVKDLGILNSSMWTIMSDKQKGLVEAVNDLLPHSEHRFCVMHLYQNFKLTHRGLALKEILWRAARATRVVDFNRAMQSLKDRNVQAYEWLQKRDPKHWSRSHFLTLNKSDLMYNNLSESFNSMILPTRNKPIVKMLEEIRLILMLRIGVKRKEMLKHTGVLCPNIEEMLDANKERSHSFKAIWNGHDEFNIEYSSNVAYKVSLGDHTCSCRRWQLTGIPCPHAICGMYYMGYNPEDYVDNCYKTDSYLKAYGHFMHPLNSQEEWAAPQGQRSEIIPPKPTKMPGRPRKYKRRLQPDEKPSQRGSQKEASTSQTRSSSQGGSKKKNPKKFGSLGRKGLIITCKTCGAAGHNSRTCGRKKAEGLDIPAANPETTTGARKRKPTVRSTTSDRQAKSKRYKNAETGATESDRGEAENESLERATLESNLGEPEDDSLFQEMVDERGAQKVDDKGKEKIVEKGKHKVEEKGKHSTKKKKLQIFGGFNPLKLSPRKRVPRRPTMSQPLPIPPGYGKPIRLQMLGTLSQPLPPGLGQPIRLQEVVLTPDGRFIVPPPGRP